MTTNPTLRPHADTRWLGRSMLRPYKNDQTTAASEGGRYKYSITTKRTLRPHPGTRWLGRSMLRPYKGEEGNHRRSRMISRAALAPEAPVRPLPGCVPEPQRKRPRMGVL